MSDRVAVVTGGASGFGRALAGEAAKRGMHVVLLDLDAEGAEREAAALGGDHGVEAVGMGLDVADGASVQRAAGAVSERFGRADLVVSNVGVQLFGGVERLTEDEWRWVLDVNVVGAARTATAFLPLLRRAGEGRLVFTSSSGVLAPASRLGAYQASKFALWGLAETLRLELAGEPVAVSVVFPSGMLSRHLETSAAAQPEAIRREVATPDDFEAMMASNPSMASEVTTPEEAAAAVFEPLLAGEPYVVTHGDLVDAVDARWEALRAAAERARGTSPAQA